MKNPFFVLSLFVILFLFGCSSTHTNTNQSQQTGENTNHIDQSQQTGENAAHTNSEIQETPVSNSNKSGNLSSQAQVVDFDTIENSNPIFLYQNQIYSENERFKVKPESYDAVKRFLKKINGEALYDLKGVAGDRSLKKSDCEWIMQYAKKKDQDVDFEQCNFNLNQDNTYSSSDPLLVSLYQIEDTYLYLKSTNEGREEVNYMNMLYNIKTQEITDFMEYTEFFNNVYVYKNVLWFWFGSRESEDIKFSYNLITKKRVDVSKNIYNKSYNWQIIQSGGNLTVQSFDTKKTINLGKIATTYDEGFATYYKDFLRYFETNQQHSYFALLDSVSPQREGSGHYVATIRYGRLKKNGLAYSKTYQVHYERFETECSEGANSALLLKDNLIITRSGCPAILELAVFDIDQEKFIYRDGMIDRDL